VKEERLKIGEFFAAEYRRMIGYVRKLIDDSSDWESEDIVQDVMTGIFEAADISRPVGNISAYIYRSLRNRVIDKLRGRRSIDSLDAVDSESGMTLLDILEDSRADFEEDMFMEELRAALLESIEKLPDDQRTVVIMTEFEGKTFREISENTGVPVGTLLARKSRALEWLRRELNQYNNLMEF